MTIVQAVILGITEGITEFLPVSSTGHLIIVERLLGIESTDAVKSFSIIIQLGAIGAALVVYWKTLVRSRRTCLLAIAGFVPTAILGAALHGAVKTYLLGSVSVAAWSLLIGGIVLIAFELLHDDTKASVASVESMTLWQAVLTGAIQTLAVVPGVSRSAATIIGGMAQGISRKAIVEYSFLLAIPTMAGASVLDIAKSAGTLTQQDAGMIGLGFLVSFASAYVAIRWLIRFVQTHSLLAFGVYRIAVAGLLFAFVL